MPTTGARELRRAASRWLARVRAGEEFVVTDRKRPIARLSPLLEAVGYDTLLADGRITVGSGRDLADGLADLDADLSADQGPSVSAALASLRADERG